MKIALGCDHGGINLKPAILEVLNKKGIEVEDFGCFTTDSVDYPDYSLKVAEAVSKHQCDAGILMCGTGIGISIAANKVKGIRAAVCHDLFTAEMCKRHNNANIIAVGGRIVSEEMAAQIIEKWLDSEFEGGRHSNRVNKISAIEEKYFK